MASEIQATTVRATNLKANDGTTGITVADSTGNVSVGGTLATTGNTTVGGTLTSTGAITASGGIANAGTITAGTIGGSVNFPSKQVLQVHSVSPSAASGSIGSETRYLKADGSGWNSSYENAISFDTKQANSNFLLMFDGNAFTNRSSASGYEVFCHIYGSVSTSSGSGSDVSLNSIYEDCRSSNYISGQQNNPIAGSKLFSGSHSAGTTLYFYLKVTYGRVYMMGGICTFTVMEIAT